jgi:uncharacterized protein
MMILLRWLGVGVYEKPLPKIDKVNRPYWEGCREGKLLLPRCAACGHRWFPPAPNCPRCLSAELVWDPASGRGTLWSWNVFHQAYFKGFRDDLPYLTALIKLAEGPFMTSTVVNAAPGELRCDRPVEVVFEKITDDFSLPKFRLAEKEEKHAL